MASSSCPMKASNGLPEYPADRVIRHTAKLLGLELLPLMPLGWRLLALEPPMLRLPALKPLGSRLLGPKLPGLRRMQTPHSETTEKPTAPHYAQHGLHATVTQDQM